MRTDSVQLYLRRECPQSAVQYLWNSASLYNGCLKFIVNIGLAGLRDVLNSVNDPSISYTSILALAGGNVSTNKFVGMDDLDVFAIGGSVGKKLSAIVGSGQGCKLINTVV